MKKQKEKEGFFDCLKEPLERAFRDLTELENCKEKKMLDRWNSER